MFDNSKQTPPHVSRLVGGICKLAGCLEDRASDAEREEALHEALRLAYEIEDVLNSNTDRINYLDRLAMTDSLTGLLNRRGFQSELQRVLSSARRYDETGVLAYIDLDDFKVINDSLGHACGDEVLRHISRVLERMTRGTDYVARLGGDEFVALLVRTNPQDGEARIAKIIEEINTTTLRWEDIILKPQASYGVQLYNRNTHSEDLVVGADRNMYDNKRIKRDKCTLNAAQ